MNVKAPPALMVELALMKSMGIIAFALQVITTPTVKMVWNNLGWKNDPICFDLTCCLWIISEQNECESSPCSNGATCIDELNQYHCICAPGYNYTHCQNGNSNGNTEPTVENIYAYDIPEYICLMVYMYNISEINECESNPCSNGATCVNEINEYHCICPPGYNYTHCQNGPFFIANTMNLMYWWRNVFLEVNECESSPCSNGGTCVNLINGYHCICTPGYNYTHCQNGIYP